MKKLLKSCHGLILFLIGSSFILAGCCCPYNSTGDLLGKGKNHQRVIPGELNPSGMDKVVTYRVVGRGIEPERSRTRAEAILMAERAAVADGYRLLVEKLYGVYLDSQAFMKNGSVDYTLLQTETNAWLRGAEVLEINRLSNGITEAEMVVKLAFFRRNNGWFPRCYTGNASYSTQIQSPVVHSHVPVSDK